MASFGICRNTLRSKREDLKTHIQHSIDAVHQLGNPAVQMGYVKKVQSMEDKRVFHVSLTEKRNQALKKHGDIIGGAPAEEDLRQFESLLND